MTVDIYSKIDNFIELLTASGFTNYATDINEAKLSGSMASEMLGLVSLELEKAQSKLGDEQVKLIKISKELLSEICAILNQQ